VASLFQLKAFLNHWLTVVDQHSIHSPYFFDFYNNVVRAKDQEHAPFSEIEKVRTTLLSRSTEIQITDLGAGSKTMRGPGIKLADIARVSASSPGYASLYFRIAAYAEAKNIVELGTSLGLTTLYLSRVKEAHITTFEGSHALANVALTHFEYFETKNIRLIEGDLKTTLPDFLQNPSKINFVFMDANHRYAPTLQYFEWIIRRLDEKSVMVVDDIHWSSEMEKAWNEMKKHPVVYGSVDLFQCGILFFEPGLNRQHFVWSL